MMANLGRGPTVDAKTGMSEDLPVWQGSRPRAAAARAPVGQEIAQKGMDGVVGGDQCFIVNYLYPIY